MMKTERQISRLKLITEQGLKSKRLFHLLHCHLTREKHSYYGRNIEVLLNKALNCGEGKPNKFLMHYFSPERYFIDAYEADYDNMYRNLVTRAIT